MDERQTKIVAGAGLEESRLNTDFIDFLRRWGSHLLLIIAGVAAAYSALAWWQRREAVKLDTAYAELSAAEVAGSPDNLMRVASDHAAQGAVRELATIEAADAYLTSGWSGVAPGGDPTSEDDRLTDEQRRANFQRARDLYAEVAARVASEPKRTLHLLDAKFGFAAASASLGETAAAEQALKEVAALARERQYPALAAMADGKLASLAKAGSIPPLYAAEQVKVAERPISDEVNLSFPTPGGSTEQPGPVLPELPAPEPTPEAAPAPAPTSGDAPTPTPE